MALQEIQPNEIGLTRFGYWCDLSRGETLTVQLKEEGVAYESVEIPHIVGMGGCASLVMYSSPRTGHPVTILVIPRRPDIDAYGEDYYYFEGMSKETALESEPRWLTRYDRCRELVDASDKPAPMKELTEEEASRESWVSKWQKEPNAPLWLFNDPS